MEKTMVWLKVLAVIVLLVFGLVFLTNGHNGFIGEERDRNTPTIVINADALNHLLTHRSRYIGDANNVNNLLGKLPYGAQIVGISLKTGSEPYGITVNYRLDDVDNKQGVEPVLIDNALILFALIENVETVRFNIISTDSYEFELARTEMQPYFNDDLWSYSASLRVFEEFLMDISFEILVFPSTYSPAMSIVPGMRLCVSLNAQYYSSDFTTKYAAEKGGLSTWESGIVSDASKTLHVNKEYVYWKPLDMTGTEDTITISILDKDENIIIEKQLTIFKDGTLYTVKPSYDILFTAF